MFRWMTFILLYCICVHGVYGTAIELLHLDNTTCPFRILHLNEYDATQIEWDGRALPPYCKMSFIGRSLVEALDTYKVCVETLKYDIATCEFSMKYFDSNGFAKEYSCNDDLPPKFCADEDEYLAIQFKAKSPSSSSVTLLVSAQLMYQYKNHLKEIYIGVSVGAVICVAVVCVVLYLLYRRKKNQPRNSGMVINSTPVQQQQTPGVIVTVPSHQTYLHTGQGLYPTQTSTMVVQQSAIPQPPRYSEIADDAAKIPLSH